MSLASDLEAVLGHPAELTPVSGGDINDAYALAVPGGGRLFVKAHASPPPGTFAAEAAGLLWLAEPGALGVPAVLAAGERWLVLEWIEAGQLGADGEEALGRGLAAVQGAGAGAFGATPEGTPGAPGHTVPPIRIGPILLPNDPAPTWAAFYAERRIAPLTAMARERGALPDGAAATLARVCERMGELAGPEEPPARLHGDVWSGNVMAGADGRPFLVDPCAHGGHRECDLAMLRLFGGPSERCFAAYAEAAPLADGHAERVALWQLAPLLVHAVLFGGSYGAAAARSAARYA